ncbi:zinc finger CCHC, partial [Pristimantis euphronides]
EEHPEGTEDQGSPARPFYLCPLDPAPEGLPPKTSQQEGSKKPTDGAPPLEPWMRQTVALKLKEVDGKVPDMDQGVFGKKMILDQGFSKSEVLCLSALFNGLFLITFATVDSCRRYWEMVQSAAENSPFAQFWSSCPVKRDERRITVSMRNPHIPGGDISTFLSRHCRVVREPTHILDVNGFWTGKWAVIVRLYQDFASKDRLQHLPQFFSLGNSSGLIYYQPAGFVVWQGTKPRTVH